MSEAVTIGRARLFLGDCRDILPTLGRVDAVVTDPPYLLSDGAPGEAHQFGKSLRKFESEAYKAIVNGIDYAELFNALAAICQPMNAFVFCSNKQVSSLMSECERRRWATTLLVWHKTNAAPFANGVWRGDIEYIVHTRGKGATFNGGATEKTKVIPHPIVQDDRHPTVKPLPVIERLVRNCSDAGQTILDPFMGSGTTGVAAVQMGRDFIGIEREPRYFEIAVRRIEEAQRQSDLFIDAAPKVKPVQDALNLGDAA